MYAGSLPARIRVTLTMLLFLPLLAALPAPVVAQEGTPNAGALFIGETFVGETSDPDIYVAIVLGGVEGDASRPARSYLCDGMLSTVDVWLEGEAIGDQLSLSAADGGRLKGVLNPSGIGGAATLGSGLDVVFTAQPATGPAGLYTMKLLPGGRLEGDSAAGATIVGAVQAAEATDAGRFLYDVMATEPDGAATAMTISTGTTEEGTFRTIILPDGRAKGQGKTKRGTNWVDPEPVPRR